MTLDQSFFCSVDSFVVVAYYFRDIDTFSLLDVENLEIILANAFPVQIDAELPPVPSRVSLPTKPTRPDFRRAFGVRSCAFSVR